MQIPKREYTREELEAVGGVYWEGIHKGERIYFNGLSELAGEDVGRGKVYYDLTDKRWRGTNISQRAYSNIVSAIRARVEEM